MALRCKLNLQLHCASTLLTFVQVQAEEVCSRYASSPNHIRCSSPYDVLWAFCCAIRLPGRLPQAQVGAEQRIHKNLLDKITDGFILIDGVFYAELNEFFQRELAEEGYSGVEVRVTPTVTDIIIRATHTQEVLGEQGRRIRELTSLIQKRFKFPENSVSLYAAKVQNRGLSAVAQCESLRYKLLNGLAVRRACYGVLRFIMESGAKGCEVVVSGKLRAARAKSMKFTVRLCYAYWTKVWMIKVLTSIKGRLHDPLRPTGQGFH